MKIDYPNNTRRLKAVKTEIQANEINVQPRSAHLSNIRLDLKLEVVEGAQTVDPDGTELYIETVTLVYGDGTAEELIVKMPPSGEKDNEMGAYKIGYKNAVFDIGFKLPYVIDSAKVTSVLINGVAAYTA